MKPLNFLSPSIEVRYSQGKGRGVFTRDDLRKNSLIEVAPVIVMLQKDRVFLDQTLLHDYIFEWGDAGIECCMALGFIPLYNHSYASNCEYEMNFSKETISVKTVRAIKAGEELFINYNGDWNDKKPLWFEAK